jgi:hypothetical protein
MASQLDTFQKWWNSYLEPRGIPVTDLVGQLKEGYIAFRLLEALEKIPAAPVVRGKAKILGITVVAKPAVVMQRLDNLNRFIQYLTDEKKIKVSKVP